MICECGISIVQPWHPACHTGCSCSSRQALLRLGCGSWVPGTASADFASPSAGTGTFGRVQLVREKKAKHFFALKVMSIPEVIRLKQEQHVHNEKSVLKEVSHPFLVKL